MSSSKAIFIFSIFTILFVVSPTTFAANITLPPIPTNLPSGGNIVITPKCAITKSSGVTVKSCLVTTNQVSQVKVTLSGLKRNQLKFRVCTRSVNYLTEKALGNVKCQTGNLPKVSKNRNPITSTFTLSSDLQSAVQSAVSISSKRTPSNPSYKGVPAVAQSLTTQLPPNLTCVLGQKDSPLTASNGQAVGQSTVCANGTTSSFVTSGRIIAQLPAGNYRLRTCIRISNYDNRTLRGDVCSYRENVQLKEPGYVWADTPGLTFNPSVGQYPSVSTYSDVIPSPNTGNDYANTDIQENEVQIIAPPPDTNE